MAKKPPKKPSDKAVLAGVRKEMARPRVAESAKKKKAGNRSEQTGKGGLRRNQAVTIPV